jgi:hypothetical protein
MTRRPRISDRIIEGLRLATQEIVVGDLDLTPAEKDSLKRAQKYAQSLSKWYDNSKRGSDEA